MDYNDKDLVSAVITTHNRLEYLKRAIESVLSQTYPNIECIVVSDASTDGTDKYCNSRTDIKYISIPKSESHGGNYARNLGIKAANGKYVAFLDDDDAWLPTKIEKQVSLLKENKCECVYCLRIYEVVNNGEIIKHSIESTKYSIEGDISKTIFRHAITSTSCILATKSILDRIGGFDIDLYKIQEYELLIRISQLTEVYYYHDEPLVLYTSNNSDKSRISNDHNRLPIAKEYIEKKHKKLLKKSGFYNMFRFKDWMFTALYRHALKSHDKPTSFKYGFYYYLMLPFRTIINILFKFLKLIKGRKTSYNRLLQITAK